MSQRRQKSFKIKLKTEKGVEERPFNELKKNVIKINRKGKTGNQKENMMIN